MRSSAHLGLALVLSCGAALAIQADTSEIIRRSIAANEADWNAQPNYSYLDTSTEDGQPSKTYQVLMIDGSRYSRLVAVDGKPLPPDQAKEEMQKLQAAIARRDRESASEHAARVEKYRKQRDQEHLMFQQMTRAFNFRFAGETKLDGHDVYVFDAEPRPDYVPPNQKAKVLTGMRGRLWIDKATYHWVKVQAEVVQPVSISGFLAKVEPGTQFTLENRPVAPNVWLPARFSMNVQAKILGLFSHNSSESDTYSHYRPNAVTLASLAR
jgi:hypothetical protein